MKPRADGLTGPDEHGWPEKIIELDDNQFPIAPKIPINKRVPKTKLEQLYKLYITQHYCKYMQYSNEAVRI